MVILVKETIKEFGYSPDKIGYYSKKRIVVMCDDCHKIRTVMKGSYRSSCYPCAMKKLKGTHREPFSEETCKLMSENHANVNGKNNPFYGKTHTKESIKKIKEGNTCYDETHPHIKSERLKKHFKEHPEAKERMRKQREKQKMLIHHTKPELKFEEICKNNNLPFHYVGDSQLWIGKEKKLNPDFCELNGKKIVIEIFGEYWHSQLYNPKIPIQATLSFRKEHYKKYGWKSVFVWGNDLKRKDAEQFVLNLLKKEGAI